MSQISALRARATELKITFDQRWGKNKLIGVITAEEEARGIPLSFPAEQLTDNKQELPDEKLKEKELQELLEKEEVEKKRIADEEEAKRLSDEEAAKAKAAAEAEEAEKQRLADEAEAEAKKLTEAKADDVDAESLSVKNISQNPMTIGFVFKAKPGFTVTLTGNQLTDKLRKKIAYGVELGLLELV